MITVGAFLAAHAFAVTTRATYLRALAELIGSGQDLSALSAADLLRWVERPSWGSSHRYVVLTACKRYLRWRFGADHPALAAVVRRRQSKRQRVLSLAEAERLLSSFDTSSAKGSRDLAICALALDTGLRCSELCRLLLADVDLDGRTLQVIVKGGQWSIAVYSLETASYMRRWLDWRRPADGVGTLFVSTKTGRGLVREGLNVIVRGWGKRLGMKLSPHDLRRSFATISTLMGAPSRVVQAAGRWSSIEMVELYTRGIDARAIEPYLPVARLGRMEQG